jgi:hypothetical protein
VQNLCRYWEDTFDWKAQTERLSELHHYRGTVDGVGIHFIHERKTSLVSSVPCGRRRDRSFGRHHKCQQQPRQIGGTLCTEISRLRRTPCWLRLMTEKNTGDEAKNTSASPPAAKKPYMKPEFRYERAFETMALSCGKIRASQALCRFNRKNS